MKRKRRTPGPDALITCQVECKSCGASAMKYITVRKALKELFEKCPHCGGEQTLTKVDE